MMKDVGNTPLMEPSENLKQKARLDPSAKVAVPHMYQSLKQREKSWLTLFRGKFDIRGSSVTSMPGNVSPINIFPCSVLLLMANQHPSPACTYLFFWI